MSPGEAKVTAQLEALADAVEEAERMTGQTIGADFWAPPERLALVCRLAGRFYRDPPPRGRIHG